MYLLEKQIYIVQRPVDDIGEDKEQLKKNE